VPDDSVHVMDGEQTRFRLFGTDGVRGVANQELTAELVLELAVAAAHVLGEAGAFEGHRPLAVVGRDPRASGEFLEAAVVAGLASAGVDVLRLGVLPTPAVAYLTAELKADLGVMLSASHNPMPDNGIKFFARGGHKLADELEDAIEARLLEEWQRPIGAGVGRVHEFSEASDRYVDYVVSTVPNRLDGLKVVVDCANGAASFAAPEALRRAGATVIAVGCEPDGLNINEGCGSTHLDLLSAAVVANGADLGVAHDGDADRCLAVAADGSVIDGDQILAILAIAMNESGRLAEGTVVATVMSNLGFRLGMEAAGIKVVETAVGDRYVLEAMRADGYTVGGEQSGHVILLDYATTGDGILTALQLLARVAATKQSLTELAAVMHRLPQVLINVTDVDRTRAETDVVLLAAVERASDDLGGSGRVLLRPSGTEPVVRVMVEAATREKADAVAGELARVVRERLG
jgi:phosphoglucosamine mutase